MSNTVPACAGVLLKFNNGSVYSLFPDAHDPYHVLNELSTLTRKQETTQKHVSGTNFSLKLPSCEHHVLVAFLPEITVCSSWHDTGMMNVYAIEAPEDGQLTKEDVQNRFCEYYGSKLLEEKTLTVEHYGERVDCNDDNVCPSGTILLAASEMSRSSSCEFSPLQIPPTFHHPPEMEQNSNQNLCVPTISPHQSTSSNAMVSGNSSVLFPIPQESDTTSSGGSYREGPVHISHPPQQLSLLHEVEKPERKNYGDTHLQEIAIETPANEEQLLINVTPPPEKRDQERNETDSHELPAVCLNGLTVALQDVTQHNGELKPDMNELCSFQEKEKMESVELVTTKSSSVDSQEEGVDHHHGNSDMVIGMQLDRVDVAKGSERVHGKLSIHTFSDPHKLDQLAVPKHTRASSLTSISPLRRESVPESIINDEEDDARPPLERAKSLPTSSLGSLLAVNGDAQIVPSFQRQSSGINETVMEGKKLHFDPILSQHTEEHEAEFQSVDFLVGGSEDDTDDLSDSPKQLPVAENLSNNPPERSPVDTPSDYPDQPFKVVSGNVSIQSKDSSVVSEPSVHSKELSAVDWLKQQVHILEHACNDTCSTGEQCVLSPRQVESVEQMKEIMEDLVQGGIRATDDLKKTIVAHCDHCNDEECKVPHRAAGCLPPGECIPTSSSFEESDTPYTRTETASTPPTSYDPVGAVSVDTEAANMSTTSMVKEYNETRGPMACTEEGNHHLKPSELKLNSTHPRINAIHSPALRGYYQTTPNATPPPTRNPALLAALYGATPTDSRPYQFQTSTLGQTTNVDMTATRTTDTRAHYHTHNYCDAPRMDSNFPVDGGRYAQFPDGTTRPVYIQPNPEANVRMRNRIEPVSPALPDVGRGGFPPLKEYTAWISHSSSQPMVIFSNQHELVARSLFVAGLKYPRPSTSRLNDEIDKGGNGKVYNYLSQSCELAVKLTCYRPNELNVWYKLNHRNIVPLYGVMLHDHRDCFQIMPRMTTNLRKVLRQCGDLHSLLKQETPKIWYELIYPNASYIFREVLCGLEYLHSENVQDCDMKASNILILKTCQCPDILHCSCPSDKKCEVRIADFDSVKKSLYPIDASRLPTVDHVAKTEEDMAKVMGTKTYRAPEQFQLPKNKDPAYKQLYEGCTEPVNNLEGPHCDIWSLGCTLVQFCIGALIPEDKLDVSCLHQLPQSTDITPATEGTLAITRYKRLSSACFERYELIEFSKLAERCLELNFKKRPTATELLKYDVFKGL